ncbi:hypothetical protein GLOIN_2v1781154 [Rhizophagus irregularis DAOM 181602=DAOM 197198]|uniref:Uncharacterized protein n=1 Tax=Rhizophagus irregularis (strain DAOM 181602 / DAOM 197198 / MUCL 43194) TaxID=747089 RepID=A0A2P4PKQ2_RHIID|nr:hypothetical protein GLOIN_2v1781154 [Rhizophagus irregularis DAOM 181602=DAOM 197198]POG65973.1 hypothetical protein GLOIN_2v1781154 [Rhizophagus irregularis DAOM 181602=DAOM 197198]|eukprot:XP_025172839.1 hypothetical protein GLOIN_2v1781154 [Rhizophagus irregularis DAOM 181602=DAOM 197198]
MLYIYYSAGLKLKEIIGYGVKLFKDLLGKNSEEWLRDFQKNVIANQINFAPDADEIAGRAKIDLLFELYLEELAITEIGKVGVEIATGVNLISTSTFNEDWSIAGKKLTVNVSVALNAGEELLTVTIAPVFGQLAQGSMLIEQFVNHIKRIENITKTLVETEKFILIQKQADTLSSFSIAQPSIIQPGHYTDTDIKKLQAKKTLTKKSDLGKKKADQIHSDCFFEEVIKNMDDNPNENDDPVEKMCKP